MAYLRKLDLAIESARKLARIGAGTNLVNLLRKMRPADVAVIFGNLTDGERSSPSAPSSSRMEASWRPP